VRYIRTTDALGNVVFKPENTANSSSFMDEDEVDTEDSLKFFDRLETVWNYIADKLPDKDSRIALMPVETKTTSLLTRKVEKSERTPSLPLAPLARSSFQQWNVRSQPHGSFLPSGKFPVPRKMTSFEKTSSPDFLINPLTLLPEMAPSGSKPSTVTMEGKQAATLETEVRRGISAASLKEWMLLTVKTILSSLKTHLVQVKNREVELSLDNLLALISTSLDLMDSIGKASETVMDSLTQVVHTFTLLRRDVVLAKIPGLSLSLMDNLRHAPIVPEVEDITTISNTLFRGVEKEISMDRERQKQNILMNYLVANQTSKVEKRFTKQAEKTDTPKPTSKDYRPKPTPDFKIPKKTTYQPKGKTTKHGSRPVKGKSLGNTNQQGK
jgi:hypothetical protein